MRALGVICDKTSIRYTVVDDNDDQIVDAELIAAPSSSDRGEQLDYLLKDLEDLLRRTDPVVVYAKRGGGGQYGSSPERSEVEAVVQVAAHRAAVPCQMLTSEQIRAAAGATRGKGAYQALLEREDVASRPSKDKRERYLYAVTALRQRG